MEANLLNLSPTERVSHLCTQCGLCCDGSLFEDLELMGEEESYHCESIGLMIDDSQDVPLLLQPCPALKNGRCSVYDQRPQTCRDFYCGLAGRLQDQQVDIDSALNHVQSLKNIKSGVYELFQRNQFTPDELSLSAQMSEFIQHPKLPAQVIEEAVKLKESYENCRRHFFPDNNITG